MKTRNLVIIIVVALVAVAGLFGFLWWLDQQPGQLDGFGASGAKFYGAFWCSHCQNQKAMFGSSKKYLPYIECSTLDSQGQLPVCTEKKISGYPTWIFADGSILNGEVSLENLASKTSCQLP